MGNAWDKLLFSNSPRHHLNRNSEKTSENIIITTLVTISVVGS